MPTIKDNYVDGLNKTYEVRNLSYDSVDELTANAGTFIRLPESEANVDTSSPLTSGVYLYKTHYNPSVALRLYKDFITPEYTGHLDHRVVSKLQEKQKLVTLTDFPTGIVTIRDNVVGQEIPYYEDYDTIYRFFHNRKLTKLPTHYYIEILKILKELYSADIVYSDIHTKNLLVNRINETIKLIDFEYSLVGFDDKKKYLYMPMIYNLKSFLLRLSAIYDIEFDEDFDKAKTLEQIEECVLEKHEKLLKRQ